MLIGMVGLKGLLVGRSLCDSRPDILGFARGLELPSGADTFLVRISGASVPGMLGLEGATGRGVELEGAEVEEAKD